MNYWFTSDWHLSHYNLMKKLNRPFESVYEMNDFIIDQFHIQINRGDIVYFLGDLSWDKETAIKFFQRIPKCVQFHYIYGSHDKKLMRIIKNYATSYAWLKDIKIDNQPITLSHYMMYPWNKPHYGAWRLYGHPHRRIDNNIGKNLNVDVDSNNFKMLNFKEIKVMMRERPDNWNLL